jgi:hypothetical protein
MTYSRNKRQITEAILEEMRDDPDNPWKNHTVDKVLFFWWMTGRSGSGLRLTEIGHTAFTIAKIEYYEFKLEIEKDRDLVKDWDQYVKQLNKKIRCPYYIGIQRRLPFIRIYDHKVAVMMTLYGNLQEYLESVR